MWLEENCRNLWVYGSRDQMVGSVSRLYGWWTLIMTPPSLCSSVCLRWICWFWAPQWSHLCSWSLLLCSEAILWTSVVFPWKCFQADVLVQSPSWTWTNLLRETCRLWDGALWLISCVLEGKSETIADVFPSRHQLCSDCVWKRTRREVLVSQTWSDVLGGVDDMSPASECSAWVRGQGRANTKAHKHVI